MAGALPNPAYVPRNFSGTLPKKLGESSDMDFIDHRFMDWNVTEGDRLPNQTRCR